MISLTLLVPPATFYPVHIFQVGSCLSLVLIGVLHRRHDYVSTTPAIHQVTDAGTVAAPQKPGHPQVLERG